MVNCNPETVSTDYDTSDRLYFEPLSPEEVLAVCDREQPVGRRHAVRRPDAARLARHIEDGGYRILGTPHEAIDLAEDRERFGRLAEELGIRCPPWAIVADVAEALAAVEEIGYPVLVGPSYVLGGRAMRICYDADQLESAMAAVQGRVLLDRFVENAIELDVDALCDGEEVYIAAVMQHVEEAGVHSGDSACVLPAPSLTLAAALEVEHVVKRLGPALGVVGLLNVQLAIADSAVYVLEVEPARVANGPVREQGDRHQPRRCRLSPGRGCDACATLDLPGPASDAGQREGRRPAVRAVPGRRPRARAGDALDRRGDGERRRPADRSGEGRARGGQAAADVRDRLPLRPGRGQACRRRQSRRRSQGSASSSSRRRGRRGRSRARVSTSSEIAKVADADGEEGDGRRPRPRRALRPRDQHAAGKRRARRRLPHPRGRARRPRAVRHDDLRCRRRGARDRERARRVGAVAAGAHRDRGVNRAGESVSLADVMHDGSCCPSSGRSRSARTCSSGWIAAARPRYPRPVLHARGSRAACCRAR